MNKKKKKSDSITNKKIIKYVRNQFYFDVHEIILLPFNLLDGYISHKNMHLGLFLEEAPS